jgi:putative membrane protein
MRGKVFARYALIAALGAPAAAWADGTAGGASNAPAAGATTNRNPTGSTTPARGKAKAAKNPKASQETLSDADLKVLAHIHDVNLDEIEMGQLATERASTPAIKRYAKMIVDDHSKGDKNVLALAKARNAILPTTPSDADEIAAQQKGMEAMDALRPLTGTDFDKLFLETMAAAHEREIGNADTALKSVSDARLSALIKQMRPVLVKHAEGARKILGEAARPGATGSSDTGAAKKP